MHTLPGRIRLRLAQLKGNPTLADQLSKYLSEIPGIRQVEIKPLTGSCLIHLSPEIPAQTLTKLINNYLKELLAHKDNQLTTRNHRKPNTASKKIHLRQVLTGGAILTLFYGLPPVGPIMPRGIGLPISSAALITTGYPIFKRGLDFWKNHKRPNYELIISAISLYSTLTGKGYFALFTMWLSTLRDYLQDLSFKLASKAFSNTLIKSGTRISLLEGNVVKPVLPGDVLPGDLALFRSGDCVPVDGDVISGKAKTVTGEVILPGQSLEDGISLTEGNVVVKVRRVVEDTSLARLADILDDSIQAPSLGGNLARSYAERLLPLTMLATFLVFLITRDVSRAIPVLLAGAPGPAGLAAPTALSAATGAAAGMGIAIQDNEALERVGNVDVVIFNDSNLARRGGTLHPALRRLSEEGYQIKDLDPCHLEDSSVSVKDFTTSPEAMVNNIHSQGLSVAWVSGPEKPTYIKSADINIVILTGKETTISEGQILCYKNDPRQIYRIIALSRKTMKTIQQNVFLVQGISLTSQLLAVLGLVSSVPAAGLSILATISVLYNSAHSLLGISPFQKSLATKGTFEGLLVDKGKCFTK